MPTLYQSYLSRMLPQKNFSVAKPPVSKEDPKLIAARRKAALEAERKKKISQEFLAKQQAMQQSVKDTRLAKGASFLVDKAKESPYVKAHVGGAKIAKGVQEVMVRTPIQIGQGFLEGGSALLKRPTDFTFTPKSGIAKAVLGEEPVKSIPKELEEIRKTANVMSETIQPDLKGRTDLASQFGRIPMLAPAALAYGGIKATDLTPIGGARKQAAKEIAEQVAKRGGKEAVEQVAKKGDDALIQEARKYKSADEFIKAKTKSIQLNKINELNPMTDTYHTGIRSIDDIKTFRQAFDDPESFVYPDYTKEMATKTLKDGKVRVYSSKPLDNETAQFVTPSKMNATDYAGGGKVYSKTVSLDDVAWINGDEGQLIGKTKSQLTDIWNQAKKTTRQTPTSKAPTVQTPPRTSQEKGKIEYPVTPKGQQMMAEKAAKEAEMITRPPVKSVELPPEQKIMNALSEAKPIRAEQEALYTAERSKRIKEVTRVGDEIGGEAGYQAQKKQLVGAMPKIKYTGIREKVSQKDIDYLFDKVSQANISEFNKISAKNGLAKLLGAKGVEVPTKGELAMLSDIFSPEFVNSLKQNKAALGSLWDGTQNALNLPRAVLATADLSAPFRQGFFLIGRPKQFGSAFVNMFKYAFNPKAYDGLMDSIKAHKNYPLMQDTKLALTDMGDNLMKREESFMSNLAERIPGFGVIARGSNRAYSGFLNKLRADVFNDLITKAGKAGSLEKNPKLAKSLATYLNAATGRGNLPEALESITPILNAAFFSPRLMASRLSLLNPYFYIKMDPFVRKEAIKDLLKTSAVAGTVLGLASLAGAEVGKDPRSTDFLKIKIGDKRWDVLGGFQQYMVAAARLRTGEMVSSTTGKEYKLGEGYKPTTRLDVASRFFTNKTSPLASFIITLMRGQTSGGQKIDLPVEVMDRFIPMVIQDMYELSEDEGFKGLMQAVPAFFGVGLQKYGDQIPLKSVTPSGKPTIKWRQEPSMGEDIVNVFRGKTVEPVEVKSKYDEAQELKASGKLQEALDLVNSLSKEDYELYKKFKQKDDAIKRDELKMKMQPVYKQAQELKNSGKLQEALDLVNSLSKEEYAAYQAVKKEDYKTIQ